MSRMPIAATLSLCLLLSACGGSAESEATADTAPAAGPANPLAEALGTITEAKLREHLEFLASDELAGRMTGTPGYDEAADYVAAQFEALGLEPAGDDDWYQHVPLLANRIDVEQSGVIFHQDSGDNGLRWKEDYVMGGDKARPTTTVRAEVVYAGFGVHAPEAGYSDYDGVDVTGKIVAIFGGAPAHFDHNQRAFYSSSRTKREEMVARGAVGYIAMRSRVDQKRRTWEVTTLNAGITPGMSWVNVDGHAADHHPEIEGSALLSVGSATELFDGTMISFEQALDAADQGRPASTPLGVEVTITQVTDLEETTSPNVVAILPGSDPELKDEYVVFSAHLDHVGIGAEVNGDKIYNGFYDNAMGVTLLIEAARAFASMPEAPKRSILFIAVTAEERGLIGSDYFARYPTVAEGSLVANVNLDMPLLLYPLADIIAFGAEHSSLEQQIEAAIAEEDFALTPDPMPEEVIFIRSDQYSFVRQGVPSVFLVPGFTSTDETIDGGAVQAEHRKTHYHRPSDDLTRPVHWESALRFARANVRIGYRVASDAARPSWNEGDFFGEKFGR